VGWAPECGPRGGARRRQSGHHGSPEDISPARPPCSQVSNTCGAFAPASAAQSIARASLTAPGAAATAARRTALLCLLHDTQETRTGDIPSVERGYVTKAPNEAVTEDQTAGLPGAIAQALCALVGEYEARQSLEAQLARDADKLECLLQAREYQASGHTDVAEWIRTSASVLRSPSARRLADLCQKIPPSQWWAEGCRCLPAGIEAPGRLGLIEHQRPHSRS
jgi:putative hydrolases of HD superfamily